MLFHRPLLLSTLDFTVDGFSLSDLEAPTAPTEATSVIYPICTYLPQVLGWDDNILQSIVDCAVRAAGPGGDRLELDELVQVCVFGVGGERPTVGDVKE